MRREDFADLPSYYLYKLAEGLKREEKEVEGYRLITTGTNFDFLIEDYKGKKLVFPVKKISSRERYDPESVVRALDCGDLRLGRLCVWTERLDPDFVLIHLRNNRNLRLALRREAERAAEFLEVEDRLINLVRSFRVEGEEDVELARELKELIEGMSEEAKRKLERMGLDSREFLESFSGPLGEYVEPVRLYRFLDPLWVLEADLNALKALERETVVELGLGPDFYLLKMKGVDVSDDEDVDEPRRILTFTRQRVQVLSRYFGEARVDVASNSIVNAMYLTALVPSDWGTTRLFRRRRLFPI